MQISAISQNYTYTANYRRNQAKCDTNFDIDDRDTTVQTSTKIAHASITVADDDHTQIGSKYTLSYDTKANRIIARDGKEDAFVHLYDGTATNEELNTLNHYDQDIKNFLSGILNDPIDRNHQPLKDRLSSEEGVVDIGVEVLNPSDVKFTYELNGEEKSITMGTGEWWIDEDFDEYRGGFRTTVHKDYDPATNSISFAIGDCFMVNGREYRMTSENVRSRGSLYENLGEGMSREDIEEEQRYSGALSDLMLFAEGKWGSDIISEEDTSLVLSFLRKQGVDTSKDFTVNQVSCHLVNGRIVEVGNTFGGAPLNIGNRVFDRQNSWKLLPLGSDNPYPTFRDFAKAFSKTNRSSESNFSFDFAETENSAPYSAWLEFKQACKNYIWDRNKWFSGEQYNHLLDDMFDENNKSDNRYFQKNQYINRFEKHQQYLNGEFISREYSYN